MSRLATTLLAATVAWAGAPMARASEAMAAPAPASAPREGRLACGDATLTASTRLTEVADHDRQVLAQGITLVAPGHPDPVTLKLDARRLRQPFLQGVDVLDASATGWACVKSASGKAYVYVMMTCTESPKRPACAGDTREWVRLYDTRGRALNAGYPHGGSRTPALLKRLGLGGVLADGVSLADLAD